MIHAPRAWFLVLMLVAFCSTVSSCGSPSGNLPVDSPLVQFQPPEREALIGESAWSPVSPMSPAAAGQELDGASPEAPAPQAPRGDSATQAAPEAMPAPEPKLESKPESKLESKPASEPESAPEPRPEPKATPKPAPAIPASPGAAARMTWGTPPGE